MKKLQKQLKKYLKVILFIIATVIWSLFVYLIDGEWLYFIPLIAGDVLFWETISWQFLEFNQGEKAIPYFMKISKSQSRDEKLQQNRFLTEWLESILMIGLNPNIKF